MRRARGESGVAVIVTRYLACAASQQNAEPLLLRAQFIEPFERSNSSGGILHCGKAGQVPGKKPS